MSREWLKHKLETGFRVDIRTLVLVLMLYLILLLACAAPSNPVEPTPSEPRTVQVGDTLEIHRGTYGATINGLMMTLLSCHQSAELVANGPIAKSGMKFVIVDYSFKNDGVRELETPFIDVGEVKTDRGYFYKLSHKDNLGGFEKLLPEESIQGRVAFEVPEDQTPEEISLVYVPAKIRVTSCAPSS